MVAFFSLHLLVSIPFRTVYIVNLAELIVGNITDCTFRETEYWAVKYEILLKKLGEESKIEILGKNETKSFR